MATQLPISTISYNSESFLREKLEELYKAHIIQSYMYICHKGEDGDKNHIHLRIEPNKRLDVMNLQEVFVEPVRDNAKPLGVRPFRPSKEEDWILYAVHDSEYLAQKEDVSKCEKIAYDWKDIKADESFDVETAFLRAKASLKHSSASVAKSIMDGKNPAELIFKGESPFVVYTITRALTGTDYTRLTSDYHELRDKFNENAQLLSDILLLLEKVDLKIVQDEKGIPSLCLKDGTVLSSFKEEKR